MGDKITVPHILKMKQRGERITCLTAYDYSFARILDEAGVEMLLVGDSLGCVVQGGANTLAVTMDEMIYHTRLVARGRKRALVIGDMPFMSYQTGKDEALRNAGRFFKEAGAEAIKLEGGVAVQDSIRAIVDAGMPVMGHIGLTPQSVHQFGGYKVQGRESERRDALSARCCRGAAGRCVRGRVGGHPSRPGRRDHRALNYPDYRYWRGHAVRRSGAGDS